VDTQKTRKILPWILSPFPKAAIRYLQAKGKFNRSKPPQSPHTSHQHHRTVKSITLPPTVDQLPIHFEKKIAGNKNFSVRTTFHL